MFTYLGGEKSIKNDRLVGIFDFDTATESRATREFLTRAQREGRISEALDPGDIPRSFAVSSERDADGCDVYFSHSSPNLLRYRAQRPLG